MEEQICNWSPQLIIDLINAVIWPFTVLVIGLRFRSGIYESIQSFFSKNNVSEVSATASGITARFIAAKQSSEATEVKGTKEISLPEDMSAEAVKNRHDQDKTEYSEKLYEDIKIHLSALNLSQEEEIELLAKETSLLQSALRYFDINKVLFRSQFDLFSIMANNSGYINQEEAQHNFLQFKNIAGDALSNWDWTKYIAYPMSSGLITYEDNKYKLTELGKSYVDFMSRRPQLVDELAKL